MNNNYHDGLTITHDPTNPNPWLALYLDQSVPFEDRVKNAWLRDCSSWSRQFLLPIIRPLARLSIVLIQVLKIFMPRNISAPILLHKLIVFSLNKFVRPEANWLILRHFHIGSEALAFIAKNVEGVSVPTSPLRPRNIKDLADVLFIKHDINLFNFVINLSKELRDKKIEFIPKKELDFSMITPGDFKIDDMPNGFFNFIDLETAIEIFTPVYQLFLTDNDFWRATNSLQLDETIAIYVAKILKSPEHLVMLNNKHPLAQLITLQAGWRLVLHGLSSELLRGLLLKKQQDQIDVNR